MAPKIAKMWPKSLTIIENCLFFLHFSRFHGANLIFLDLGRFWEGLGRVWGGFWKDLGKVSGGFGGIFYDASLATLLVLVAPISKLLFTCFRVVNFRFRCFLVFAAALFLVAVFSFHASSLSLHLTSPLVNCIPPGPSIWPGGMREAIK